jgi:hypothetical protein
MYPFNVYRNCVVYLICLYQISSILSYDLSARLMIGGFWFIPWSDIDDFVKANLLH